MRGLMIFIVALALLGFISCQKLSCHKESIVVPKNESTPVAEPTNATAPIVEQLNTATPQPSLAPLPKASDDLWSDPQTWLTWQVKRSRKHMTWNQAKAYCDNLTLDGYDTWRLPTISELRTLIRGCPDTQTKGRCQADDLATMGFGENASLYEINMADNHPPVVLDDCKGCREKGGPAPGGKYWPSELKGNGLDSDSWFWSSVNGFRKDPRSLDYLWLVDFNSGAIGRFTPPILQHPLTLCVLPPLFKDVWNDQQSGLTWQVSTTGGKMNWFEATSHCQNLKLAGYSDWRLPTISELRTLIRSCPDTEKGGQCRVTDSCLSMDCWGQLGSCDCRDDKMVNPRPDGMRWPLELSGDCCSYWSSSTLTDAHTDSDGNAWFVYFQSGGLSCFGSKSGGNMDSSGFESDGLSVRCVR